MTEPEYDRATVAEFFDPIRYIKAADSAQVVSDLALLATAGAALAYAIYYGGKDFVLSMPDSVQRAYARACTVYDLGGHRSAQRQDDGEH